MSKRSVALSLLKFITITVALTSLAIASATYLRDAVGVGSRGQGGGTLSPYGQIFNVWYFTTQEYHVSFQSSDADFEGVLIVKSVYGEFSLERQFKQSLSIDFKPSTKGFYTVNVTSTYPKEVGSSFSVSWTGTEFEEDIINPALIMSFVFMIAAIILDIGMRMIERSGTH
jgi:hypothetical protein